jgi:bifunctional DNA-binding transcriptional regulator/antitoxin component of YhaV-PrlF toxin-antitoxin module
MSNRYRTESTLSDRGQTAIPSSIRKHLGLEGGGKIEYEIDDQGRVIISSKIETDETAIPEVDPALQPFLSWLEKDIQQNPEQLEPISSDFLAVAIAIAGSWENLINFDPDSFDFTDNDAAQLSDLFAEIEAEEAA